MQLSTEAVPVHFVVCGWQKEQRDMLVTFLHEFKVSFGNTDLSASKYAIKPM